MQCINGPDVHFFCVKSIEFRWRRLFIDSISFIHLILLGLGSGSGKNSKICRSAFPSYYHPGRPRRLGPPEMRTHFVALQMCMNYRLVRVTRKWHLVRASLKIKVSMPKRSNFWTNQQYSVKLDMLTAVSPCPPLATATPKQQSNQVDYRV